MMIETPNMPVWSGKSSTRTSALFVPLTRAIPSQGISRVRLAVLLTGPNVEVQPGIQYSADGINWDTAKAIDLSDSSYWVDGNTTWDFIADGYDCPAGWGAGAAPTLRLFVRFGVFVNNISGSKAQIGTVQLRVVVNDIVHGSVSVGPMCTPTGGGNGAGTTYELFTPMTQGVPATQVNTIRVSFEQQSNSGNVATRPGYQVSKDGLKWTSTASNTEGTYEDPGVSPRTSDGITYGTVFSAALSIDDYQWIRFGIISENSTGSNQLIEAVQSNLRVDWRGA